MSIWDTFLRPFAGPFLGVFALFSANLHAFDPITDQSGRYVVVWERGEIDIEVALDRSALLSDGTTLSESFFEALRDWNAHLGNVQFDGVGVPVGRYSISNGISEVAMDDSIGGLEFDSNTLAVTVSFRGGDLTNYRKFSDIIFNSAWEWDSYRGPLREAIDIRRVALHELGHVLGLDHPDEADPVQSVLAVMNSSVGDVDGLRQDDIDGGHYLYGPPDSPPVNDNFQNAVEIGLGVSGGVTVWGNSAQSSSEAGEPLLNFPVNGGGRTVWWKWTAAASGHISANTTGSSFDTMLGIYVGDTVGSLDLRVTNDDIIPGVVRSSEVSLQVSEGITYYFLIDGWSGYEGHVQLNVGYETPVGPNLTVAEPRVVGALREPATLSVDAEPFFGGTLTYQWFENHEPLVGETGPELLIEKFSNLSAGVYRVVVDEFGGGRSIGTVFLMPDYKSTQVSQIVTRGLISAVPPDIAAIDDIIQVAAGDDFGLGLKRDGTVVAWPLRDSLQAPSVLTVPDGLSDVVAVAAGHWHALALRADGIVVAWGETEAGQSTVPIDLKDVVQITGGLRHSVARRSDGSLVAWGELDDGDPAYVPGNLGSVIQVSARFNNTVVLKEDGSAYSWGEGVNSQPTLQSGLAQIQAHASGGIALTDSRQVLKWGTANDIRYWSPTQGYLNDLPGDVVRIFTTAHDVALLQANGELNFYGTIQFGPPDYLLPLPDVLDASFSASRAVVLRHTSNEIFSPQGTHVSGSDRVMAGQELVLNSRPSGSPSMTYQWYRGSVPVIDGERVNGAKTPTLRVDPVTSEDAGTYKLLARNSGGSAFSRNHMVAVDSIPEFTIRPLSQLAWVGKAITFQASATGEGEVLYSWSRNGSILKQVTGESFAIDAVSIADRGRYTVTARDENGEAHSHFFLHVTLPGAEAVTWDESSTNIVSSIAKPYGGFAKVIPQSTVEKGLGLGADGRAIRWGDWGSDNGTWSDLESLVDVVGFASDNYAVGLRNDGTLVGAGIGFNTRPFPAGMSEIIAIAGDGSRFSALSASGQVAVWQTYAGNPHVPHPNNDFVMLAGPNSFLRSDSSTAGSGVGNFPTPLVDVASFVGDRIPMVHMKDGTVAVADVDDNNYLPPELGVVSRVQPGIAIKPDGQLVIWHPIGEITGRVEEVPAAAEGAFEIGSYVTFGSTNWYWTLVPGTGPSIIVATPPEKKIQGEEVQLSMLVFGQEDATYQWYRNGQPLANDGRISGANQVSLSISDLSPADVGSYSLVVTSSGRAVTSLSIPLEITLLPQISRQPQSRNLLVGGSYTLSVGTVEPGNVFQWSRNGVEIVGASSNTLILENVQLEDAGNYIVSVTNELGTVVSDVAVVGVEKPAPVFGASHQVTDDDRIAGNPVVISNEFFSDTPLATLSWSVLLPDGWSFADWSGPDANSHPEIGSVGLLEWDWQSVPVLPVEFAYTITSPASAGSDFELAATFVVTGEDIDDQGMVLRDPLILRPGFHTADTNRDMRLNLSELLRVIELYNTRHGSTRTGRYRMQPTTTDGFAPDDRSLDEGETPSQIHRGDINRDGRFSLSELLRIIELYNTRSGSTRTGAYRVDLGSTDGFAPEF
ncbi:MAG: hypothetical protein SynsKO_34990 [Synoicihabitans sp.]